MLELGINSRLRSNHLWAGVSERPVTHIDAINCRPARHKNCRVVASVRRSKDRRRERNKSVVRLPGILKPKSGVFEAGASYPGKMGDHRDVVSTVIELTLAAMFAPEIEVVVPFSVAVGN